MAEGHRAILNPSRGIAATGRRNGLLARIMRDKYLFLLGLPGIAYFIIFKYVPMLGVIIAFKDYSPYLGFIDSPWVGLEHFRRFFTMSDFSMLLRNTLAISLLNIAFFFPLPILLAILLNEVRSRSFKRSVQTILYLPHFLSWVIIVSITFLLLSQSDGLVNKALESIGFGSVDFLVNKSYFWPLLTLQSIWKEAGWGTIVFLAAVVGVSPSLYEAATIDGAGRLRQIWHVTLPGIRHVIVIMLVIRLGHVMDLGFEQVYLMMNGAVSDVAEVFETYAYRVGIQQGYFSFSTAVGLFKSAIGLIMVVGSNAMARRFGEEGLY